MITINNRLIILLVWIKVARCHFVLNRIVSHKANWIISQKNNKVNFLMIQLKIFKITVKTIRTIAKFLESQLFHSKVINKA